MHLFKNFNINLYFIVWQHTKLYKYFVEITKKNINATSRDCQKSRMLKSIAQAQARVYSKLIKHKKLCELMQIVDA